MPDCLPFYGWRYNPEKVKIEEVVAPPYDVVGEEEKAFYQKKSPYNIFHLELPETYQKAKHLLEEWIRSQILVKEPKPCLYFYELSFMREQKTLSRKGWILLVKLHHFEEGIVLPHEKVFPKVTDDRFELLKTTGFQFSQIFGLYEDPDLLTISYSPKNLLYEVTLDQQTHHLYQVSEVDIIKEVTDYLKHQKIYIADGHHRYTTALRYKEYMENKLGTTPPRDYHYIAMYVCPIEEPNLLMLPTHRIYRLPNPEDLIQALKNWAEKVYTTEPINFSQNFFKIKERDFGICFKNKVMIFRIKQEVYERFQQKDPVLSKLTLYNFLSLMEQAFQIKEESLKEQNQVEFISEVREVFNHVKDQEIGVIFPELSPLILKEVALQGKRMPHKSTFFYPKILTGLVLNEVSGKPLDFKL